MAGPLYAWHCVTFVGNLSEGYTVSGNSYRPTVAVGQGKGYINLIFSFILQCHTKAARIAQ